MYTVKSNTCSRDVEAHRLVRVFLGATAAAAVMGAGSVAGTGQLDGLLLPALPGFFAAVVWTSDYETK